MKQKLFIMAAVAASAVFNPHTQAAPGSPSADDTNRAAAGHELLAPPVGTNAGAVLWRFGSPTARTNRFNQGLPVELPPPAPDLPTPGTNPSARRPAPPAPPAPAAPVALVAPASNPPAVPLLLSPLTGSNGFTAAVPQPVVWQFGAPTSRTNKFNPLLPMNPPPPVPEKPVFQTNAETNHAARVDQPPPPAVSNAVVPPPVLSPPALSPSSAPPVLWQYGAPTLRTNRVNDSLPTNLPPPAPAEK